MPILLSVGSRVSPQKRLHQNVWTLQYCFMSQTEGGLGGNATKCWKSYFPQIRLPPKVWSKLFQSPRGDFINNANLTKCWKYFYPWERLPQSVWSSWQFQSHKLGSVLVEMQFLPSIGSSIPHKLDCLKLCDRKKKYKSKLGGGFGSNAIFTQ